MLRAAIVAFLVTGASTGAFAQQTTQPSPAASSFTPGSVVLLAGHDDPQTFDQLKQALRDPDPEVRATAARVIAVSVTPKLTNDVIAALAREQVKAVGAELLRALLLHGGDAALPIANVQMKRIGGEAAIIAAEWMAREKPEMLIQRLPDLVSIAGPSAPDLADVLDGAVRQHPEQRDALVRAWAAARPPGARNVVEVDSSQRGQYTARTLPVVVPALLQSTLAATGCKTKPNEFGIAVSSFSPDGRPAHIDVSVSAGSRKCQEALAALARVALLDRDEGVVPSESQIFVLPLTDAFATCVASEPPPGSDVPAAAPQRLSSTIVKPEKVHNVNPFYPAEAQRRGIQGVVIVEEQIAESGCVRSARVLRSIPFLDAPALLAVSEWVYTPTVVQGTPVPVVMTATLNFTLK